MAGSSDDDATTSHSSESGLWRRSAPDGAYRRVPPDVIQVEVDPPPKPLPAVQTLALVFIAVLVGLQFLPATHLRDPADPHKWIPINPNATLASSGSWNEKVDIFSWINCLDLRMLAVLANSTLVNSRVAENIHFHFFVPEDEDEDEQVAYYKLKVLFPRSNLEFVRQKDVIEKVVAATTGKAKLQSLAHQLVPFILPSIYSLPNRYVYLSPNTIVKGNIEELSSVNLGPSNAIAAAEDCSKRLGDYASIDTLNAFQRSDPNNWVSDKPYDKDACLPNLELVLLDASRLKKDNLVDGILWWSKILDVRKQRDNQMNPAIVVSLYDRYRKLPHSWKLSAVESKDGNETSVVRFDGPSRVCSNGKDPQRGSQQGETWQQYLPPNSDAILSIHN